jgi:hypothetical protein
MAPYTALHAIGAIFALLADDVAIAVKLLFYLQTSHNACDHNEQQKQIGTFPCILVAILTTFFTS